MEHPEQYRTRRRRYASGSAETSQGRSARSLVPGSRVGAQGGDLESALRAGLRKDGRGMLINVSRSVARAEKPGLAAAELRDHILSIRR